MVTPLKFSIFKKIYKNIFYLNEILVHFHILFSNFNGLHTL